MLPLRPRCRLLEDGLNGRRLTLTGDEAYDLVISVAAGQLDNVDAVVAILQDATGPRR